MGLKWASGGSRQGQAQSKLELAFLLRVKNQKERQRRRRSGRASSSVTSHQGANVLLAFLHERLACGAAGRMTDDTAILEADPRPGHVVDHQLGHTTDYGSARWYVYHQRKAESVPTYSQVLNLRRSQLQCDVARSRPFQRLLLAPFRSSLHCHRRGHGDGTSRSPLCSRGNGTHPSASPDVHSLCVSSWRHRQALRRRQDLCRYPKACRGRNRRAQPLTSSDVLYSFPSAALQLAVRFHHDL